MLSKLSWLSLCLVFVACAPTSHYNISECNIKEPTDLTTLQLNLKMEEEKIYQVDVQPNPSEAMAAAYVKQVTVPEGVNTAAGSAAVTAGNLLAQVLITESHKNSLRVAANKKADPMRHVYPKDRLLTLLEKTFLAESEIQKELNFIDKEKAEGWELKPLTLTTTPEIRFSNDLARLEMKLNVSIAEDASGDPVYKNTFEYWSPLVGPTQQEVDRGPMWTEQDGQLLATYLREGCKEVFGMLAHDLQRVQAAENPQPKFKTLKIFNERGYYYMRGCPIKTEQDRVWLRDLRGNIRSYHGTLTNPSQG